MSDAIERFGSGAPWEAVAGYSRAVRVGDRVLVAGTTATLPDGTLVGEDDAGAPIAGFILKRTGTVSNLERK